MCLKSFARLFLFWFVWVFFIFYFFFFFNLFLMLFSSFEVFFPCVLIILNDWSVRWNPKTYYSVLGICTRHNELLLLNKNGSKFKLTRFGATKCIIMKCKSGIICCTMLWRERFVSIMLLLRGLIIIKISNQHVLVIHVLD